MNTERQRDRANRSSARAIDPASTANGQSAINGHGAVDGAQQAGDVEDIAATPTNGDAALISDDGDFDVDNGHVELESEVEEVAPPTNGHSNGGYPAGNGNDDGTVLVLQRRRRRVSAPPTAQAAIETPPPPAPASTATPATPAAPSKPQKNGAPANGVTVPQKAQRASTPQQTAPVAPPPAPARKAAPAKAATPAPTPAAVAVAESAPRQWRFAISLETVVWVSFLLIAIGTRLWDLSNRGIHHDESLHSVYSYNLYDGTGYVHDPMMHGPLQFHLIAFMYWLFGPNEMTARMASAFCGIWVVMSPFFLRRQLGRFTAIIAGFLLLVSPGILYFSRMAREDAIFSGMEMIFIVGLLRFVFTRRPSDFFVLCAGLALMFTIKETTFLTLAVLGGLFAILFVIQSGYAITAALIGYGAAAGGWALFVMKNSDVVDADKVLHKGLFPQLPNIPNQGPDYQTIANFAGSFITHPLILGTVIITLVFVAALITLFRMQRMRLANEGQPAPAAVRVARRSLPGTGGVQTRVSRSNGAPSRTVAAEAVTPAPSAEVTATPATTAVDLDPDAAVDVWDPRRLDPKPGTVLARYQPGSVPHLLGSLFSRPSVLLIGLLIFAIIFTTFYTVFFTDVPRGIASGMFASLGYWMAQQGVARGEQPWYYYFLLVPLYEPIAVFFSVAATIFFGSKGVRWLLRNRRDNQESRYYGEDTPRLGAFNTDRPVPFASFTAFLAIFMIWWVAGVWFIYSWAGEKMPWLLMHITRPSIILAALFLGALVSSIVARRKARIEAAALVSDGDGLPYEAEAVVARPNGNGLGTLPTNRSRRATTRPFLANPFRLRQSALTPAYASTVAFSRGSGGGARSQGSRGDYSRRRLSSRAPAAAVAVARVQEAPWVNWSRPDSLFPALSFITLFVLFALCYGMTMNLQLSAGKALSNWGGWAWTWVWPVFEVALVLSYAVWVGPGRALRYVALGIFSVFFIYEFRSATQLAYFHPDVSTEMASYVQTSPDVTRTMRELNDYSTLTTGGKNAKVLYDDTASWPFSWYLREYKNNARFIGSGMADANSDAPVQIVDYGRNSDNKAMLDKYVAQRYAMRWWFPEEWYKNDLMSDPSGTKYKTDSIVSTFGTLMVKLGDTFTKPDNESTLWNYLMFRETPRPLGSTDMMVYVRKDIAQLYHRLQYAPNPSTDLPVNMQDAPAPVETPRPIPSTQVP